MSFGLAIGLSLQHTTSGTLAGGNFAEVGEKLPPHLDTYFVA